MFLVGRSNCPVVDQSQVCGHDLGSFKGGWVWLLIFKNLTSLTLLLSLSRSWVDSHFHSPAA